MTFAWPHLLWLIIAPILLLGSELARRRASVSSSRPHIIRAEAGMRSIIIAGDPRRGPPSAAHRRALPRIWLCAGLALAAVALARPQWGQVEEPLYNQSRDIILALDLSRSMLTADVSPSRLEREKLLVQSLLERLHGERVGLVVFSGTAFLQSPLTPDYEMIREFLPSIGPAFLPVDGTNYGPMIDTAAAAFDTGTNAGRYLIILSDGGANDEDWRSHIGKLTAKGVRVIGLGIGTAAGGFVPDAAGGFMKDESGAVVLAKLESGTLRELAHRTGGVYRDAGGWVDLPDLLKSTVESAQKGRFVEKVSQRQVERFQWALAPAVLCLLLSFWREFPVRPKPREVRLTPAATAILFFLAAIGSLRAAAEAVPAREPPDPGATVGRIVGRISAQDHPSALDWAELGQETVAWGQHLQSARQNVAPGPVRDALAGVDAGSALDAKAANWPEIRSNLEALLRKPEPPKKKEQQKNSPKDKPQPQDKKPQESKPQNQAPSQPSQKSPEPRKSGEGSKPPSPAQSTPPPPAQAPDQSASQRVGGVRQPHSPDAARADPAMAIPLQKMDQVKNQDSPAELYRMIENREPRPPAAANGKNW